jgi:hypothetical protein
MCLAREGPDRARRYQYSEAEDATVATGDSQKLEKVTAPYAQADAKAAAAEERANSA